ncbi:MAG: YceI family protein [Candidatus Competibacterales bacterium]
MKPFVVTLLGALVLAASGSLHAADSYRFDKAHTQILFFISHLGFSQSQGEFLEYDGQFTFDPEDLTNSAVEVAIATGSIDMDMEKWDAHMRSADFFDVEQYPEMRFVSTAIEETGDNTFALTGDFTLLGKTLPVTLDVTFNKAGRHPFNGEFVAGFSATTTIKRSDFGMNYGLPAIGDEVHIRLEVEGIRQSES